jgi:hypothetical protein
MAATGSTGTRTHAQPSLPAHCCNPWRLAGVSPMQCAGLGLIAHLVLPGSGGPRRAQRGRARHTHGGRGQGVEGRGSVTVAVVVGRGMGGGREGVRTACRCPKTHRQQQQHWLSDRWAQTLTRIPSSSSPLSPSQAARSTTRRRAHSSASSFAPPRSPQHGQSPAAPPRPSPAQLQPSSKRGRG